MPLPAVIAGIAARKAAVALAKRLLKRKLTNKAKDHATAAGTTIAGGVLVKKSREAGKRLKKKRKKGRSDSFIKGK